MEAARFFRLFDLQYKALFEGDNSLSQEEASELIQLTEEYNESKKQLTGKGEDITTADIIRLSGRSVEDKPIISLQAYAQHVKRLRGLQVEYFKYPGKRFELINKCKELEKELDSLTDQILNPNKQASLF